MEKQSYFFTVAYRGTNYHGWQKQPNALTVQEVIEKAFSIFLNEQVEILGSGRTDAGVHANGQVFQLAFTTPHSIQDVIYRANKLLPEDIAITEAKAVPSTAHARFDAISRSYVYRMGKYKNPFAYDLVYFNKQELDYDLMNLAAKELLLYTDFESFSKVKTDVNTFNCEVFEAIWKPAVEQVDQEWVFHISANRFLRGMVRAIVGTLLEVGLGRMTCQEFKEVIEAKNRRVAGSAAPAHGLYLTEVKYPASIYL